MRNFLKNILFRYSYKWEVSGKLIFIFLIVILNLSASSQTVNLDSLLTEEELNWLNKNKDSIRYAPNPSWPPGDYVVDGIHKGFVSDYIKIFEEMLGVDFVKVNCQSWTEILNGLKNKEIDFIGAIHKTDDREDYLLFTEPFKTVELGIITKANYRHDLTKEHINSMSLACVKNYTSTQFIRREFPGAEIILVDEDLEALLLTSYGSADGAVTDFMTTSFLVEKYGISNLKSVAFLDFYWELRFASRDKLPEFNSILNKLLKNINEEQHQAIFKKWVNIDYVTEPNFFEKHQKIIICISLFILILLVIAFIFNYFLHKQVKKQTFLLKKARDIAKKNEEKYKTIAENTSDVIWLTDLNLNTTHVSPSVEKMLGEKVSEHMKKTLEEKFPPHSIEKLMAIFHEELEKEKKPGCNKNRSRIFEVEHYHADGSTIWVEINVSFIRDTTGKPIGLHGIARNITKNRKSREYIERRLKMEKLLSKISRIAIGNYNTDVVLKKILKRTGQTLDVNRVYIIEYDSQDNAVSNTFEWCAKGITPQIDNLQQLPCNEFSWFFDRLKQGKIIKYKNIENIPDESTKEFLRLHDIISILVVPLSLNNIFYGCISFDECKTAKNWHTEDIKILQSLAYVITSLLERHKTESELRIKDRAIELSLVAKAILDLDGKITYANKTFLKYWRYQKQGKILNKPIYDFWELNNDFRKIVAAIMEKGSWKGELKCVRSDRTVFDALVNANFVTSKNGKPLCILTSFSDITERKIREKELINAKEKAEESDRFKSAFLANVSHEIRTPMNGILGFMELLKKSELDEYQKNTYIDLVNKSGQRLLDTINNIIDISKIETGAEELKLEEVNINDVIEYHYNFFKSLSDEKRLEFIRDERVNGAKAKVITDKNKLDSILENLIKNALKFTSEGYIKIGNYIENDYLKFYVKDTGRGIPADRLEAVFDRFIQVDMSISRSYEGSGLGLSIVRAYVDILGGNIEVQSEVDKGTLFTITIPYKLSESNSHEVSEVATKCNKLPGGLTILVAEDDEISYKLLETILAAEGINLIRTINGKDTIRNIRENPDIPIVLMDIKMSGMNGIDATRKIREFNKDIIIIAQTGFAMSGDKEKMLEAGCNEYISKPIKRDELLRVIEKYC